ncbi:hypothetical protein OUZ56_017721 [Daphnia magna]|uniref:FZ domain-containing protein n=1 Tax=Daphnia magna TaxID=35525 RepID=A0ABR0ATI8_9CRUS|nr:hypothetical protein OUZ56_017721 [Daphnia magna]
MAVSLSSHLMGFSDDTVACSVAQMDEIEDLITVFIHCYNNMSSMWNTFTCNNGVDNLLSNMYALILPKCPTKLRELNSCKDRWNAGACPASQLPNCLAISATQNILLYP